MHTSHVRPSQVAHKQQYSGDLHAHQADVNGVCFMSLKTGTGCDLPGSEQSRYCMLGLIPGGRALV
jgi:hypothetical protein